MTKSGFDLADLRRLAVRKQLRIKFPLSNGMECIIGESGIARVPGLQQVPGFNLEEMLTIAERFELSPAAPGERVQSMDRAQMGVLLGGAAPSGAPTADHDE